MERKCINVLYHRQPSSGMKACFVQRNRTLKAKHTFRFIVCVNFCAYHACDSAASTAPFPSALVVPYSVMKIGKPLAIANCAVSRSHYTTNTQNSVCMSHAA